MIGIAMSLRLELAGPEAAPAIAALRNAVAEGLTLRFGKGHWSGCSSERGVLYNLKTSRVYVAWDDGRPIATLSLATKKPWAIDTAYFTPCKKSLYLTAMAVAPDLQRQGLGRRCLAEAEELARAWPSDAIRLDAYDAAAGAGGFYAECGYREVGRVTYRTVPLIYYEKLV